MEHYYYLGAAVCCATIIIGSLIWLKMRKKKQAKLENSLPDASSEKFSVIVKSFSFDRCLNPFNMLLWNLHRVNVYEPKLRASDAMDIWFRENTRRLMHDGVCLAYINNYGHLENVFWKNIEELGLKPENDVKFQCLLISISPDIYYPNFSQLLRYYINHWELLPKVKMIMDIDARFENLRNIYVLTKKSAKA